MIKRTELAPAADCDLQIIEYRGQRVATSEQLAAGYRTDIANIKMNYSRNAGRFAEGVHFFKVTGENLAHLRVSFSYLQISSKTRSLMLWTERGAASHAKMLETDKAWDYFNYLTEFYFNRRVALPSAGNLSRLEILQIAIDAEQGRLAEKARADAAERTKAQISCRREASALGKLGAVTRRCRVLEERLGEGEKHATITKVERITNQKGVFKFAPLRRWCRDNGPEAKHVPDDRYGSVKAWPAEAWLAVYNIDLKAIAGGSI